MTATNIAQGQASPELPPLPNERQAEDFYPGQNLLALVDVELLDATVESAPAYPQGIRTTSPGFLRMFIPGQTHTRFLTPYRITDMDFPGVMTYETLESMKNDRGLMDAYLASIDDKDVDLRDELEAAITERLTIKRHQRDPVRTTHAPGRARQHAKVAPEVKSWQEPHQLVDEGGELISVQG